MRFRAIIRKLLNAPIQGEGIPTNGTPQGGILSPLLSNIVLNDLDHWLASQWEEFPLITYTKRKDYSKIKKTRLKRGFIVRYADDFKIFAPDWKTAWKWFYAVKNYLKNRLKLQISPEKSQVINLRRRKSTFLGVDIKAVRKGKKTVANTYVSQRSKKRIKQILKDQIRRIKKNPKSYEATLLNTKIMGIHQYFQFVTHASKDFNRISYDLHRFTYHHFREIGFWRKPRDRLSRTYAQHYSTQFKTWNIKYVWIFPIANIRTRHSRNFKQNNLSITPKAGKFSIRASRMRFK